MTARRRPHRTTCAECGHVARCQCVTPPWETAERWLCQPCAKAYYTRRAIVAIYKLATWL